MPYRRSPAHPSAPTANRFLSADGKLGLLAWHCGEWGCAPGACLFVCLFRFVLGLRMPKLTIDERLDVLLHVKWTVKEFDCNLTREIVDLIDREADLLNRCTAAAYRIARCAQRSTTFATGSAQHFTRVGTIERRATCHTVATCAAIDGSSLTRYIACTSHVHRVYIACLLQLVPPSTDRLLRVYIACTSRVHLVRAADGRRRASRGYGGAS